MKDLQHQISVKTLALQTLQKEYDSILRQLNRQRTKYAVLEKKFNVSDGEVDSLTEDKEALQYQVSALEGQVEELQKTRDDARRQLTSSGAQYIKIMEMASKLQAQSTQEKKEWATDKKRLEDRERVLEEAALVGPGFPYGDKSAEGDEEPQSASSAGASSLRGDAQSATVAETVALLRGETSRLRARNKSLEDMVQSMRTRNTVIRKVASELLVLIEQSAEVAEEFPERNV